MHYSCAVYLYWHNSINKWNLSPNPEQHMQYSAWTGQLRCILLYILSTYISILFCVSHIFKSFQLLFLLLQSHIVALYSYTLVFYYISILKELWHINIEIFMKHVILLHSGTKKKVASYLSFAKHLTWCSQQNIKQLSSTLQNRTWQTTSSLLYAGDTPNKLSCEQITKE